MKHEQSHGTSHAHLIHSDSAWASSEEGIKALKISLTALLITAAFQTAVVIYGKSTALLADAVHNFADAFTAVPLWIAFRISRRKAGGRFSYGLDRTEDLAGLLIVLLILASGAATFWESLRRLLHPIVPAHLSAGIAAGVVGFAGNEIVAKYRIAIGKKIGSAALVADGQHARVDGFTSLGVVVALTGVALGFPIADPIAGLIISFLILFVALQSGKEVTTRLLDGIDPKVLHAIEHTAEIDGVQDVTGIRARWRGHKITAELCIVLDSHLSLLEAHSIAEEVRHRLLHEIPQLEDAIVHCDPPDAEAHHTTDHHFK